MAPQKKHYSFFLLLIGLSLASCTILKPIQPKTPSTPAVELESSKETVARNIIQQYEPQLAQDPNNTALVLLVASNYYTLKEYSKAIEHFIGAYDDDNNDLSTLINLGNLYYDSKRHEKGIEFYEKALEVAPNNADVRCDLATCYFWVNDTERALQLLYQNIALNPDHVNSHCNLGLLLRHAGAGEEAQKELDICHGLRSNMQSRQWYYKNGHTMTQTIYHDSNTVGIEQWYYQTGELFLEVKSINSEKNGFANLYYKSGKLMMQVEYRQDNPIGRGTVFDETGNLKNGPLVVHHSGELRLLEMNCHNGRPSGILTFYDEEWKIVETAKYDDGLVVD